MMLHLFNTNMQAQTYRGTRHGAEGGNKLVVTRLESDTGEKEVNRKSSSGEFKFIEKRSKVACLLF